MPRTKGDMEVLPKRGLRERGLRERGSEKGLRERGFRKGGGIGGEAAQLRGWERAPRACLRVRCRGPRVAPPEASALPRAR